MAPVEQPAIYNPIYNRVSPRFWIQAQESSWSDDMKLLGMYLLTCEHRNSEGLYRLPIEYMAGDLTGPDNLGSDLSAAWSSERVAQTVSRLSQDGFAKYDNAARVVFLPRALAYQSPDNPNMVTAAARRIQIVPDSILDDDFFRAALSLCRPLAKRLAELLPERFGKPHALALLSSSSTSDNSGGLSAQPGAAPARAKSIKGKGICPVCYPDHEVDLSYEDGSARCPMCQWEGAA